MAKIISAQRAFRNTFFQREASLEGVSSTVEDYLFLYYEYNVFFKFLYVIVFDV